jgi:hypothetical protein
MKAEHRKELESNVLVEKLTKAYQGIKQGPSRSSLVWIVLLVVVVVVFVAWRWFSSSSSASNSARWMKLDDAVFPEQLETLTNEKDFHGTTQGRLAQFKEARRHLREGLKELGQNKTKGGEQIREGIKIYEDQLKDSGPTPILRQEALLGAARGHEALGQIDKAREYYERVRKDHPGTQAAKDAEKQLERLDSDANKADLRDLEQKYGNKD